MVPKEPELFPVRRIGKGSEVTKVEVQMVYQRVQGVTESYRKVTAWYFVWISQKEYSDMMTGGYGVEG